MYQNTMYIFNVFKSMKFQPGVSALESPEEANSSPSPERLLGARLRDFMVTYYERVTPFTNLP